MKFSTANGIKTKIQVAQWCRCCNKKKNLTSRTSNQKYNTKCSLILDNSFNVVWFLCHIARMVEILNFIVIEIRMCNIINIKWTRFYYVCKRNLVDVMKHSEVLIKLKLYAFDVNKRFQWSSIYQKVQLN